MHNEYGPTEVTSNFHAKARNYQSEWSDSQEFDWQRIHCGEVFDEGCHKGSDGQDVVVVVPIHRDFDQ
jgi:hypothetical protein